MAETRAWEGEFGALPAETQARLRAAAMHFGVPLIAAFHRAKGLGMLAQAPIDPDEPALIRLKEAVERQLARSPSDRVRLRAKVDLLAAIVEYCVPAEIVTRTTGGAVQNGGGDD